MREQDSVWNVDEGGVGEGGGVLKKRLGMALVWRRWLGVCEFVELEVDVVRGG